MRSIVVLLWVLLTGAAASNALAGRIFGDIKMDGKPVSAGLTVMIAVAPPEGGDTAKDGERKPEPAPSDTASTDKFGSYKLTVKAEGKCILTLLYDKQAPTLEVFSYKEATRYDLIMEKKDGKYSLRRK
jgi:hypothetical protein